MKLFFLLLSVNLHGTPTPQPLTESIISERLREAVLMDFGPAVRVAIESISVREKIPVDAVLLSVDPKPSLGLVRFSFRWIEKESPREAKGTAVVRAYRPVAVAKSILRHNEPLTTANIAFEERELSTFQMTGYFDSWERLGSLRANGYIPMGTVLGFQQTQEPWTVSLGQTVDVVNIRKGLKVTLRGNALENGRLNQWIRVENPATKKILHARVINNGEVSLH